MSILCQNVQAAYLKAIWGRDAENRFNAELLLAGMAQVMTVPPNVRYVDLFVKLQREAREAEKGL